VLRLRSLGIKSRLDYSSYLNSTGKFGAKIIHRAIRDAEIHGISRGEQQIGPRVWLLCCPRKKMLLDGSLINAIDDAELAMMSRDRNVAESNEARQLPPLPLSSCCLSSVCISKWGKMMPPSPGVLPAVQKV
jgi:hypothetical protein